MNRQDSVVAKAACGDPLPPLRWDQDFLKALTRRYEQEAKAFSSTDQPLALSDLERQSGYSRRSLQLAFRAHLGCNE